ncbi:MAG: SDR family oxidoreductase [Terriglobia bacterium]|nr:SDR family oxidoreductase [Terriglobia bacterium]
MQNHKRVVLITAASQGIGRAIATHLAKTWTVVLLARSESIEKIGADLGGLGVRGSVTEGADLKRMVDAALERFGRIDGVVNNTGHPAKGDPLALSDTEWQQGYELILGSVIRLARLVTPVMIRQKRGAFVNISSYAAKQPDALRPVSSVFRAALSAWTRVHAEAGAPHGIRANSILPGFVDSYPIGQKITETIPMGRIGRLEELAKAVAFLLSDDASYITGQNLLLDGGMVRGI